MKTAILVEGESDRLALEALVLRRKLQLAAEGVAIVSIGGAQAVGREVRRLHPHVRLVGLCDAGEERYFRRAFTAAGLDDGVFVCHRDLEDELIRALGVDAVLEVVAARNELGQFRSFQQQPAWRGREPAEQLRRFFGTYSHRKIEIGGMLVNALDLDRVPPPLDGVLAHACAR
jgi:OLD-like protein